MPTRDPSDFSPHGEDSGKHIVPGGIVEDDALWMLLNAYVDGEATPDEIAQVESLLRAEPALAHEFAFLQLTSDSVREIVDLDPPPSMTEAIFAATTRRKSWTQRMRGWWHQVAATLAPTPVRLGLAGSLAAGMLVVVLWPRHSVLTPTAMPPSAAGGTQRLQGHGETGAAPLARNSDPGFSAQLDPIMPDLNALHKPTIDRGSEKLASARFLPAYTGYPPLRRPAAPSSANSGGARHSDKSIKPRPDISSTGAQIASAGKVEERNMTAGNSDSGGKTPKDDALGPDVDASPDPDNVAMINPPSNTNADEPPTVVTAINYKPGSISERVRNTPPPVPTLAMRAQEAIKREHDLQQYGGYGKEAYRNIQRGEVGLSLVGARF